jgi:hypothetical protein
MPVIARVISFLTPLALLSSADRALTLNVMNVLGPFRAYCRAAGPYLARVWSSRRAAFKKPLIEFCALALRVHAQVPDGFELFRGRSTHRLSTSLPMLCC